MLSLVGIGGAGCKIVDAFFKKDPFSSLLSKLGTHKLEIQGVAIDTSDSLTHLKNIPQENKVLIGKSRAKGHGTGANVELGSQIMEEELELAMNTIRKVNREKPDFFFVIAGLGGGTGTGGAGVIAERLKKYYNVEVYGVLIFPSRGEGAHYIKNAYSKFPEIKDKFDGILVQDNNVLAARGEDIASSRKRITTTTVRFFNIADAHEIARQIQKKVCGFGYMRAKENISAKDALQMLIRDKIFVDIEKADVEEFCLMLRGNLYNFYGESFAKEWVMNKFNASLRIIKKDSSGAKHLDIACIAAGVEKAFEGVLEDIDSKEVKSLPSELEELLGEIQSL